MNRLKGTVTAISHSGELSLVDVACEGTSLSAFVLEAPEQAPFIRIGNDVWILFKETEVSIAKDFSGELSLRNRFESRITKIRTGELLTELTLDFNGTSIVSIISRRSSDRMGLKVGDQVTGLVKANEITLMEAG
ncbi:MAG: hypothetical protein B6D59_02365 [Campylobacteraceae bacterium 4484_4]|nr:MAG: hypothetical protein B6D59_02365 [Campylobacteraceae bacterium 4484_4]